LQIIVRGAGMNQFDRIYQLHALLSMQTLLVHLEHGVLKKNLSPILKRLDKLLAHAGSGAEQEIELNDQLGSAYGIFSGSADKKVAILHFTPQRARWVADETWHPEQTSRWLADGCYALKMPYANDTELILDICRYGPDVEVMEPQSLRISVSEHLKSAANQYD